MLTPVDIEKVEFKKAALGYSQEDVDMFLDKIMVDYETLYKQNIQLQDKVNVLEDAIKYYKGMETTINSSIVMAEKTASETKHNAIKTAEQIIREAQFEAAKIVQQSGYDVDRLQEQLKKLQIEYKNFKTKYKYLLKTELEIIEHFDEQFEVFKEKHNEKNKELSQSKDNENMPENKEENIED